MNLSFPTPSSRWPKPDMRPLAPAPPALDDPTTPRLVLRDGSVATVRRSTPDDREAMRRFFHDLSPESRRRRFFTAAEPNDALVDRLCDSADGRRSLTLVAVRQAGSETRFIAVGSYFATSADTAEAAFAVDDRFQGKGLGTELLERLAAIAASHGFQRFDATTLMDNHGMLEVFRAGRRRRRADAPSDRGWRALFGTTPPSGDRGLTPAAARTSRRRGRRRIPPACQHRRPRPQRAAVGRLCRAGLSGQSRCG